MDIPHSNIVNIWHHSSAASEEQHSMLPEKQSESSLSTGNRNGACKGQTPVRKQARKPPSTEQTAHWPLEM